MLERTVRRMWAVITIASTTTGNTISGKKLASGALAETVTMPGSQPSQPLKTRMRIVAETNSGMVMAAIAIDDTDTSSSLSRRNAASTPSVNAIGRPTSSAQTPSSSELSSRSPTISLMRLVRWAFMPKSPRSAPPIHSA